MSVMMMNGLVATGTLICFMFFIGVVFRAYSTRQRLVYVEASRMPFDLPDEFSTAKERYVHRVEQPVRRSKGGRQ